MRKMNTIGIRQANKNMLMAAVAYNLKKYLKFEGKTVNKMIKEVKSLAIELMLEIWMLLSFIVRLNFLRINSRLQFQGALKTDYIES